MQECTLDILAGKVLDARVEFDMQLHGEQAYPLKAFEELWLALNQYAAALGDSRSLNRDVAREISGLRKYLELESFRTPGEVLAKADRMEMILFAGYDPYFESNEPDTKVIVSIQDVVDEMDVPSEEHSAFLNRHTGETGLLNSNLPKLSNIFSDVNLRLMKLKIHSSLLSNGIKTVLIQKKYSGLASITIFCRAGSRYDSGGRGLSGLAHLTEHLLFKKQEKVFREIEYRGGRVDAGTSREYVFVSAVTLAEEIYHALDLLAGLLRPEFHLGNIAKEKCIAAEEIRGRQDKEEVLFDLFLAELFKNNSLGNPLTGTMEGVQKITVADIADFYLKRFTVSNLVVSVCGDFLLKEMKDHLEKSFPEIPAGVKSRYYEKSDGNAGGHVHHNMALDQTHVLLGLNAPSMNSSDRYAYKLIDIMLGCGATSLLYNELRLEKGLVYSVNSYYMGYEDNGYFAVKTACSPDKVGTVIDVVRKQFRRLSEGQITREILANAKRQYVGRLYRSFETCSSLSSIFGIERLLSRVEPFEKAIFQINAVTESELSSVAKRWLSDNLLIVTAGRKIES
jgi:predicted Zn-dependent peptidase